MSKIIYTVKGTKNKRGCFKALYGPHIYEKEHKKKGLL